MIIALAIELDSASKAEYELSFYSKLALAAAPIRKALSHRLIFENVWKQFLGTDSGKQIKRLLTSFLCS